MNNTFFSREKAASYEPEVLNRSTVLLAGVGALGQNVLQNLALSQVGALLIVDFDEWESHNATRSPFFPSEAEVLRWSKFKAIVAAHKVKEMTCWSDVPAIQYATKPIQALGDAPFRAADLVVSAVDNQPSRNYLGRKTAQFEIPLVEGGFSGSHVNSTILLNTRDGPCWHCNLYQQKDRNRDIQLGCTAVAKRAEDAGYIPAIQSAAAYLGAFTSEVSIQLLHGNTQLGNAQVVMDMRTGSSAAARLHRNPGCPSHPSTYEVAFQLSVDTEISCRAFLQKLASHVPLPVVSLPADYLVRVACAQCKQSISVNEPDWVMTSLLYCRKCGGKWNRTPQAGIEVYPTLSSDVEPLMDLPISKVGLVPGSLIKIQNSGREVLCELQLESYLPFFTTVPNGAKPCFTKEDTTHVE